MKESLVRNANKVFNSTLGQEDFDYSKWINSLSSEEWVAFLKYLSQNRVLYTTSRYLQEKLVELDSKKESDLKKILDAGALEIRKFTDTIDFLEKNLRGRGVNYLVVKTFKFLDYVTFDVDVLVHYEDFHNAQTLLREAGCKIFSHPRKQGLHQRNCRKEGLLNIDLHRKFYWQGLEHIDLDFVWRNPKDREINGTRCLCPSLEADLLLNAKQLMYERYYVTLLDYFAVKSILESKNLNLNIVREQVRKFGWEKTFNNLVSTIGKIGINTEMPAFISYTEVWRQLFEILINQGKLPLYDFAYYHFAFLRYFINNDRLPYYDHWFNFSSL